MEYWLEDASLMDIRKAAGIEDPSWLPPQGEQILTSASEYETLFDNKTLSKVKAELLYSSSRLHFNS